MDLLSASSVAFIFQAEAAHLEQLRERQGLVGVAVWVSWLQKPGPPNLCGQRLAPALTE